MVRRLSIALFASVIALGCSKDAKPAQTPPTNTAPAATAAPAAEKPAGLAQEVDAIKTAFDAQTKVLEDLVTRVNDIDAGIAAAMTTGDRDMIKERLAKVVEDREQTRGAFTALKDSIGKVQARVAASSDPQRTELIKTLQEYDENIDRVMADLADIEKKNVQEKTVLDNDQAASDRDAAQAKLRELQQQKREMDAAKKKKK